MALQNRRINVAELDFDQIKTSLKEYLRGQSEFSDYDFEGSAMSVLLDVLTYNTHYNALYNNMAFNEMFLDSAVKRNSVVSLAKMLGYVPHSSKSARAVVQVVVTDVPAVPTPPATLVLPKLTPFTTTVGSVNYTFYTKENIVTNYNGTGYVFSNVEIYEGTYLTYKYIVTDGTKYIIPNADVDISSLTVRVQESTTSTNFKTLSKADSILYVTSTDNVYFVKEIDNNRYELTFGDGVLGAALDNGNVVHIEYFVTNKDIVNGAKVFRYSGDSLLGGRINITTTTPAYGGADQEPVNSIKFNAPKSYVSQNRAVTVEDYKNLIYNNFPEVQSVSVWGGQDNNPPVYGKVFICVKPGDADRLNDQQKSNIRTLLSNKAVVSVIPEFVDPEFIRIELAVSVYYNQLQTARSSEEIKTLVRQTIIDYNDNDLEKFDGIFKYSKLSRLIDNTEPGIVSNATTVKLRRTIEPRYNIYAEYKINLINPIFQQQILLRRPSNHVQVSNDCVTTTGFYIPGSTEIHYIEDDGNGVLRLYYFSFSTTNVRTFVNNAIGTVDYAKGIINIKNLNISAIVGSKFELIIKPNSNDVVSAYTQIATIDFDLLTLNVIDDKTATGDLRAGQNYVFTPTALQ